MPFDGQVADFRVDPLTITDPKERLRYLADFLRRSDPKRFDMNYFSSAINDAGEPQTPEAVRHDCGTSACIAGWAQALFTNDSGKICSSYGAADLLGLTDTQAGTLFYANANALDEGRQTYWDATPTDAAAVLDHLIATGEVDWSVATS